MRFRQAWSGRFNAEAIYHPPTTDAEKREIDAIRQRLGMPPLYPEVQP